MSDRNRSTEQIEADLICVSVGYSEADRREMLTQLCRWMTDDDHYHRDDLPDGPEDVDVARAFKLIISRGEEYDDVQIIAEQRLTKSERRDLARVALALIEGELNGRLK